MLWCGLGLLAPAQAAWASHNRGNDAWTDIGSAGVVTLHVTTRWDKGTIGESGVDSGRFGLARFQCPGTGQVITVDPPTAMRIVKVPEGFTMYQWPAGSFSLTGTTTAIDTLSPTFDARLQVLAIPFGSTSTLNQIVAPLNLPFGDYDIRWNDWTRIHGLQNLDPTDECGGLDDGFGFNVRVHWDGTSNHGPSFGPINPTVARGLPYSQNVNAIDADGDPRFYVFASLNPSYPDFGPQSQVPGLALDSLTGQMTIPAGDTAGLLDNHFAEPSADDLVKVRVSDSKGAVSEREILLDAVPASAEAAGLMVAPGTGSSLQISWTPACNATDHAVYWGTSPIAGTLNWTGAACALGITGTANFDPGFTPPNTLVYFVVVGRTAFNEGSYGKSSAGAERPEAAGGGTCDTPQVLGPACNP
jgi:hypothetical protein